MARPPGPAGQARHRVLDAALELFAEHGISGTSLQMIADRIGVTKAAVYHQFPAKGDIVLGLLGDIFASLEALVDAAEARPAAIRHDVVILGLVELMVQRRDVMSALYRDPEMQRVVSQNARLSATGERLTRVVLADVPDSRRRQVAWAVLGAGFTRAVSDAALADIPDAELEAELVDLAHRMLA